VFPLFDVLVLLPEMSAIFSFSSLLTVLLLAICTSTYLRELRPKIFDPAPVPDDGQV
jgi:hypothetical protein